MAMTRRGLHPDLDEEGGYLDLPGTGAERDFRRKMFDPAETTNFMGRVEAWQRTLPDPVQSAVSGRGFESIADYHRFVRRAMDAWGHDAHGTSVTLTDGDVSDMDLATFDLWFNPDGTPRPGVTLWHQRGVRLDDRAPR